jgi:CRISPR-associated protein Cst1
MLRYTGHPIADIGVATIAAFCEKLDPFSLTQEDLLKVAQFLEREYFSGKLLSYLTCVFPNSAYVQPGAQPGAKVKMKPENIDRFKRQVLYAFQEPPSPEASGLQCIFSGAPANRVVYRQHVPMITGENVLNFFPAGTGGLPISGPYLLAIQAFPLGALRCYGRALAVHSPDDPGLTYAFAHRFLVKNRQLLLLTEQSGEKYQDAKAPKTVIVHALLEIEEERRERNENEPAPSVTVYHLTNSGQGPDITLFHLPSQVVQFLRLVSRAGTQQIWRRIEATAWERVEAEKPKSEEKKAGKGRKKTKTEGEKPLIWGPGVSRNYLYEDLFDLPGRATYFVRTYFLRRAYRYVRQDDPRRAYRLSQELELVSWELTRLFLKEVIGMERTRIEAIRALGDRIAEYVASDNDRRFFQGLYRADRYVVLRGLLIKASNARLKKGQSPIVTFEEFLRVFEEGEELARVDWALARDLVLIRVIEELHKKEWFGKQPDVLEELDTEEDKGAAA